MANGNVISIHIPNPQTTIIAKKSCNVAIGDVVEKPLGYAIQFYYPGTNDEVNVGLSISNTITSIEGKEEKRNFFSKLYTNEWSVDIVCYKEKPFSFEMPWGYNDDKLRANGTVIWQIKEPKKMLSVLSNPTDVSKDCSTYYISTYARKGETMDGVGIRLRKSFISLLKAEIDNNPDMELKEVIDKLDLSQITSDDLTLKPTAVTVNFCK